jgi:hypothetical protein
VRDVDRLMNIRISIPKALALVAVVAAIFFLLNIGELPDDAKKTLQPFGTLRVPLLPECVPKVENLSNPPILSASVVGFNLYMNGVNAEQYLEITHERRMNESSAAYKELLDVLSECDPNTEARYDGPLALSRRIEDHYRRSMDSGLPVYIVIRNGVAVAYYHTPVNGR